MCVCMHVFPGLLSVGVCVSACLRVLATGGKKRSYQP